MSPDLNSPYTDLVLPTIIDNSKVSTSSSTGHDAFHSSTSPQTSLTLSPLDPCSLSHVNVSGLIVNTSETSTAVSSRSMGESTDRWGKVSSNRPVSDNLNTEEMVTNISAYLKDTNMADINLAKGRVLATAPKTPRSSSLTATGMCNNHNAQHVFAKMSKIPDNPQPKPSQADKTLSHHAVTPQNAAYIEEKRVALSKEPTRASLL